jgi:hypothetical protein
MNAPRKKWILGGLVLAVTIMVAAKYGEQLVGRFQNDQGAARLNIAGPATLQPFDERLSNMPKISWTYLNGMLESGAVRFPAFFDNTQGQMTAVVIKSETEDAFWCINAWGTGKAADLAEKIAREFVFK